MTQARNVIEDVVHEEGPVKKTRMITELFENGLEAEEAARTVDTECEIEGERVVGLKKREVKTNGSGEDLDVEELGQKPGEPTGDYFNGQRIVTADEIDGEPVGLPVLEDVGHPHVPELSHGYFPRELKGNRTDLEIVTRYLADPDFSLLLIGETGVGKNVLLKRICEICNWPMRRTNFGVGVDYESVVGRFGPRDSAEGSREVTTAARALAEEMDISIGDAIEIVISQSSSFEFIDGLLKVCVENGYMFVGDEINMAVGDTTSTMHGVTEEQGSSELVVYDTSEVIEPDPRFKFTATMNPIDYSGTNRMNQAFQTRFYPVEIPYLESEAETQVILEKSHLSEHENGEAIAESLVDIAAGIRIEDEEIMTAVSSRDLIKIGNTIADPDGSQFMPPREAAGLILKGIAEPGDWSSIQTVIGDTKF